EIRVVITGTLEEPKLTLESDAQPPIEESDLLSYLLVGRPTYAITRAGAEGGSLIGDVASGGLSSAFDYALESLLAGGIGLDYVQVSQAPVAAAEIGPSGVPPAFAATQVEVGWYLAPTVFVSVGRRLFRAVQPTVRVDWQLQRNLTVRGITEPRFAREATLFETVDLEQTFGLFLFYGWSY
ncbi:MAG: translocation/assembly module TamB domain-containing protein, partial [Gemmatimonadota bacterium]